MITILAKCSGSKLGNPQRNIGSSNRSINWLSGLIHILPIQAKISPILEPMIQNIIEA
jgi:hypothetical protein